MHRGTLNRSKNNPFVPLKNLPVSESEIDAARKMTRALQSHRGTIVLYYIDHGYDVCFWLVPFTPIELEEWWEAQETFESNPNGSLDVLYRVFGEIPPPHRTLVLPGTLVGAPGAERNGIVVDHVANEALLFL